MNPAPSDTSISWVQYDGSYPYGIVRTDMPLGGGVYRAWLYGAPPHQFLGAFDSLSAARRAAWNAYVWEMGGRVGLALPSTISTSSLGDL